MRDGELILFDIDLSIPFFSDSILIESKNIKDKTSNDTENIQDKTSNDTENIQDKKSNDTDNYEIKDFAESYLNPKNYSKSIIKNQLNPDDITSYFRFQDINILNKLNLMFIQPSPKYIITKLQIGNINKTILLIEIIFFYICLVFLVKGIIFNTNYLSIIILTISAIIIYVLIDFESYLGTYVRHRFIFWKLINSIGSIYLFQFIYNFLKMQKRKLELSIVCATHNNSSNLIKTIDSIYKNSILPSEIVICTTDIADKNNFDTNIVKDLNINFIESKRKSQTHQRELAIKKSSNDIIIQIDDDIYFYHDSLEQLYNYYIKNKIIKLLLAHFLFMKMEIMYRIDLIIISNLKL